MADSVIVTDGTTSIQLVYDASTQTEYKLKYGAQVGIDPPDVLTHTPDFGESLPVRGIDRDRTVTLGMHFPPQSNWDEVLNSISVLKRMVDGAHSQALRYWTDGDVDRVNLRIQLNGSSNYTDIPIKYGVVDDGGALYSAPAILNQMGYDAAVVLIVGPYGEGAAISLRNDLASSPHMLEDSNGDGLADGLTVVGTHSSSSISTTNYVIGGKAQRWVAPSTGDSGVRFGDVTASTSTQAVFSVWVTAGVGADDLTIRLSDGSENLIQEKTFDRAAPAGYDTGYVFTDPAGGTWYRYTVSGTNTTAANFRPRVFRTSANASISTAFFVDGAYLQTGTLTAPDAWCSTSAITNGYDTDASTANINYLDFWGIPGDSRCHWEMDITPTTATIKGYYIGRYESQSGIMPIHWRSEPDATAANTTKLRYNNVGIGNPDGTPSAVADGTRFSDEYLRLTADASPSDDALLIPLYGSSTQATAETQFFQFLTCAHRLYMVARSSSTATTFELSEPDIELFSVVSSGVLTPSSANTWEVYDLGYISAGNGTQYIRERYSSFSSFDPYIFVNVTPGLASATVDVNAIIMMPVSGSGSFALCQQSAPASNNVISGSTLIASDGNIYIDSSTYAYNGVIVGELDGILSGNFFTRYVFMMIHEDGADIDLPVATTATITTSIKPRSRHLLGVQ